MVRKGFLALLGAAGFPRMSWFIIGFLTLFVAACSKADQTDMKPSTQASESAKDIDPCAFLTAEDIETALGWKVAKTEAKAYGATGTCTYSSATPYTAQGLQQVSVVIGQGMPDMSTSEAMAQWRLKQYSGESYKDVKPIVKPVEGLGVPAIQNGFEGLFGIEMAVGGKLITVSLFDSLQPARALAEKVLARAK